MKTINLLPDWYAQQRRQQRNLRVHLVVMVLIGAAMTGASQIGRLHVSQLEARRDALAGRRTQVSDPDHELRRLQADFKKLDELRLAREELGPAIPMSAVIQQLQNAMIQGMAISNLGIDVKSEPVKGSGVVGDLKNPPRYRDVAKLSVTGIAIDNDQVMTFIGRVSKNPLFSDVTLDYTRADKLHEYSVRRFEIQLNMDLGELGSQDMAEDATGKPLVSGGSVHGD